MPPTAAYTAAATAKPNDYWDRIFKVEAWQGRFKPLPEPDHNTAWYGKDSYCESALFNGAHAFAACV